MTNENFEYKTAFSKVEAGRRVAQILTTAVVNGEVKLNAKEEWAVEQVRYAIKPSNKYVARILAGALERLDSVQN